MLTTHRHSRVLATKLSSINPLRADPTRTTTLRNQFDADMLSRFRKLIPLIWDFLVIKDALDLKESTEMALNVEPKEFRFNTDPQKLEAFNDWLRQQVEDGVLTVPAGFESQPWLSEYIQSAYKRGATNAYLSALQAKYPAAVATTLQDFLRVSFGAGETVDKLRLLYLRSFEDLKGITADMGAQISRILAQGLADGTGVTSIAKEIADTVRGISKRRALLLTQTEIIRAHAEGQLDSFEKLGVSQLGLRAEWTTAQDDAVCPKCLAMEGKTYTIEKARGLIPLHPFCRCSWLPKLVTLKP